MTLLQLPKVIEAVNELGQQVQKLQVKIEALEKEIQLAKTVKENKPNVSGKAK